jgi:phage terminase large subunit-like protein
MARRAGRRVFQADFVRQAGKSGIRPYCALIDEVHEHPDNSVIEMMRAGTKGNQEALLFEITNSGFDKKTVCGQEHDYSAQILKGEIDNDAWFAFIASLDEGDDPFEDESCWPKANPNLGVSIQLPFIREQVQEARGMPSKEGLVRRLHFCQWTESENSAIPRATWMACEARSIPTR